MNTLPSVGRRSLAFVFVSAVVCASSLARAGPVDLGNPQIIIELVPDNPGPYFGGEHISIDLWVQSLVDLEVGLNSVQFDFSDTDPALALDPTFSFEFSGVPGNPGGFLQFLFPNLPGVNPFSS